VIHDDIGATETVETYSAKINISNFVLVEGKARVHPQLVATNRFELFDKNGQYTYNVQFSIVLRQGGRETRIPIFEILVSLDRDDALHYSIKSGSVGIVPFNRVKEEPEYLPFRRAVYKDESFSNPYGWHFYDPTKGERFFNDANYEYENKQV
jgi:hypothetical protein